MKDKNKGASKEPKKTPLNLKIKVVRKSSSPGSWDC
jgi:hypothetical protein